MAVASQSALVLLPVGNELGHPLWNLHRAGLRDFSTPLRNVGGVDEPFRLNIPELVVYRAAEVHRLLTEGHAASPVGEAPLENGQFDTREAVHLPVGVDDELQ